MKRKYTYNQRKSSTIRKLIIFSLTLCGMGGALYGRRGHTPRVQRISAEQLQALEPVMLALFSQVARKLELSPPLHAYRKGTLTFKEVESKVEQICQGTLEDPNNGFCEQINNLPEDERNKIQTHALQVLQSPVLEQLVEDAMKAIKRYVLKRQKTPFTHNGKNMLLQAKNKTQKIFASLVSLSEGG